MKVQKLHRILPVVNPLLKRALATTKYRIRTVHKTRRILLVLSSLLIALATTVFSLMSVRGMFPFLPIAGESMYPSLKHGDLITVNHVSPHKVQPGDIIVFAVSQPIQKNYNYPPVIAHRVTEVYKPEDYGTILPDKAVIDVIPAEKYNVIYYTIGDKSGEDPFTVRTPELKGKLNRYYAGLGLPLLFFQSTQGLAVVISALILLVVYLYWNEVLPGLMKFNKRAFNTLILEKRRWAKYYKPIPGQKKISDQVPGPLILEKEQQARHMEAIQSILKQFASAFTEYSATLRIHTNTIQELSKTTHELKRSTEEYNETNKMLSELLKQALVVRRDKYPEYEELQSKTPATKAESHFRRTISAPPGCYFSIRR